jgi:hypothetical protein
VHLFVVTGTTVIAFTSDAFSSESVCTCAHGADHGSCPMHRTRTDSARCRLQATQDDLSTALMSVLGVLMLPPASTPATPFDEPSSAPVRAA